VADVVQRADVRVVQRGDRLGLALEALAQLLVARQGRRIALMATSRLSRVSRARWTSPIPPAPIGATIS
jgi:hypothetical protein